MGMECGCEVGDWNEKGRGGQEQAGAAVFCGFYLARWLDFWSTVGALAVDGKSRW